METIFETGLKDVLIVERPTYPDQRGFFKETFRLNDLEARLGRSFEIVQQNHSRNEAQFTLRGIHIAPWDKFIYVSCGRVQAVVADLRKESPTFGRYISVEIGENRRAKIFIPAGCGNSYLVLSNQADYMYDTNMYWEPNREIGVAWNDCELNIKWMLDGEPVLSEKDKNNPPLREFYPDWFK